MAYYGTDFKTSFNFKTNSPYSQAIGDTKMSALANEALVKVTEQIYKNGNLEYQADTIRAMVVTNDTTAVVANQVLLSAITGFNHLLACKCKIEDNTFRGTLTNILLIDGTYTRVVLNRPTKLRSTEQIKLIDTVIDGTWYVKQITETIYELYSDESLISPVYNGVPYDSLGVAKRVVSHYAFPYQSQDKAGLLTSSTVDFPKVQQSDNKLNLYAGTSAILSADLDYITFPALPIDVTDSTDDLLEFYPLELLYMVVDKAAQIFGEITRDPALTQYSIAEQQQNNQITPQ